MRRNYVGLALTVHDPAIAIVDSSGRVVFAEAIERRGQVKRAWNCVPDDLLLAYDLIEEYCEPGAELVVARNWSDQMPGFLRTFFWTRPAVSAIDALGRVAGLPDEDEAAGAEFLEQQARWLARGLDAALRQSGNNLAWRVRLEDRPGGRRAVRDAVVTRSYDHHLTHAAVACYSSPFDEAVCAIIDGYGEKGAVSFYRYADGRLRFLGPRRRIGVPTSLGIFYMALCLACGFDPYRGEEWKVMGLAAYGRVDPALYDLMRPMVRVEGLRLLPAVDEKRRIGRLLRLRRPPQVSPLAAADMAQTGQRVFAEVSEELLRNLHALGDSNNLVLGGGCALNSAFNGTILARTPFAALHVPPAPADDGTAVGAALLACAEDTPGSRPCAIRSPYLGSRISADGLRRLHRSGGLEVAELAEGQAPEAAATLLAEGRIVGWVQGRAEFGPRALGNRSVLADPRRRDIKDVLNRTIKFREEFRPFAPSILHAHGSRYFEDYQPSPYMERALRFRPEVRDEIPGVVHIDGTGRVHSVERDVNERFHDLIVAFHRRTGVPLVLNTSFNVMGKPIIHSVEDAIAVFCTTGLDALFIENLLITKRAGATGLAAGQMRPAP